MEGVGGMQFNSNLCTQGPRNKRVNKEAGGLRVILTGRIAFFHRRHVVYVLLGEVSLLSG